MKKKIIEGIIGSSVVAWIFAISQGYSFGLILCTLLILNGSLAGAICYGDYAKRPFMWQAMMIIFIGITINFFVGQGMQGFLGSELIEAYKSLVFLPIISCFMVTIMAYKRLKSQLKRRIDTCFPSLWGLVGGILVVLLLDGRKDHYVRSFSVLVIGITLIVMAGFQSNRVQQKSIRYEISSKGYLKYIVSFGIVVLVTSYMLPLMNQLPYTYEITSRVQKWLQIQENSRNELQLSRYPSISDKIICTVASDEPIYLRRLAYEDYNQGRWTVSKEIGRSWTSIGDGVSEQIYPQFRYMLECLAEGEIVVEDLAEEVRGGLGQTTAMISSKEIVIEEKEKPQNYLSVNGVYNIEEIGDIQEPVGYKGTLEDICFTSSKHKPKNNYVVYYKDCTLEEGSREKSVLKHMTFEQYSRLISQVVFNGDKRVDEFEILEAQITEYKALRKRYIQVPNEIFSALNQYGQSITVGCVGDLEKAEAIEQKLKESGEYIYKIGAAYRDVSEDPVLDFLLEGKAGICQDFASGMVLLCRSIGLPARYVDGYLAREQQGDGQYIVRQRDAHAFVEVYISGYGWMLFDPTTSNESFISVNEGAEEVKLGHFLKGGYWEKSSGLLAGGLIFLVILLCSRHIRIILWGVWISRKSPCTVIQLVLKKSLKVLENKGVPIKADETLTQYTKRLQEQGIEIGVITECFERCYYGKQNPMLKELREAYGCYLGLNRGRMQNKYKGQIHE